jgi:hypothetical protein
MELCIALHLTAALTPNDTVHRAAANDIDFKTRATRGSVCNGLFCYFVGSAGFASCLSSQTISTSQSMNRYMCVNNSFVL